jgi:hypothetical protein
MPRRQKAKARKSLSSNPPKSATSHIEMQKCSSVVSSLRNPRKIKMENQGKCSIQKVNHSRLLFSVFKVRAT